MFAICIESSHQKGMGHLFRALNFIESLQSNKETYVIFINNDSIACEILRAKGIRFEIVDFADTESGWETGLIRNYGVTVWINDRLDTDIKHAKQVKGAGVKLVTLDDRGDGAGLADVNVAALQFGQEAELKGKVVLTGIEYLILNRDIKKYRRLRKKAEKLFVTLGGSDTYGVTVKVVEILKRLGKSATVHTGPSFAHHRELEETSYGGDFNFIGRVPSLLETFYSYDLAVTGGGLTPFEANASGLPCIIVASETFEIKNGRFLKNLGSSVFAGFHADMDETVFGREFDIERMSSVGLNRIPLDGAEKVYRRIKEL